MVDDYTTNIVLVDWLSFTSPRPWREILHLLCLRSDVHFISQNYGFYGYRKRIAFAGISIMWDNPLCVGSMVEMSGQGCRAFESFSLIGWDDLFLKLFADDINVTRLDVAFDDHTGVLPLDKILDKHRNYEYRSPSRTGEAIYGRGGNSCTFGKRGSKVFIRIYDKAAERGYDSDLMHWVRIEMQMRDNHAYRFLLNDGSLGDTFKGALKKYLNFVDPTDDTNKSRWPVSEWWSDFLGEVDKVRLYTAPGVDYNLPRLLRVAVDMFGSPFFTLLKIFGSEGVSELLEQRFEGKELPPKYLELINQYGIHSDDKSEEVDNYV